MQARYEYTKGIPKRAALGIEVGERFRAIVPLRNREISLGSLPVDTSTDQRSILRHAERMR